MRMNRLIYFSSLMVLHLISKESAVVVKIMHFTSELNSTLNFLGIFEENTNYFNTKM